MNIFYLEVVKTEEEEGFEDFVVLSSVGELPKKKDSEFTSKDSGELSEDELNGLYGLDDLNSGALQKEKDQEEDTLGYDY